MQFFRALIMTFLSAATVTIFGFLTQLVDRHPAAHIAPSKFHRATTKTVSAFSHNAVINGDGHYAVVEGVYRFGQFAVGTRRQRLQFRGEIAGRWV